MRKIIQQYSESITAGILLFLTGTVVFTTFELEQKLPGADKILHFLGGAIVAWFFSLVFTLELSSLPASKGFLVIISTVALIGVLWEFAEYLSGTYSPQFIWNYFHGGDLPDTLLDLFVDMLGGAGFFMLRTLSNRGNDPTAS